MVNCFTNIEDDDDSNYDDYDDKYMLVIIMIGLIDSELWMYILVQ